mmetsp:Transcript_47453/g.115712  ORF Transcript_47453/g.115712 Transcript_47453/m.115712 type:complete len:100 (-) Transcript_47453:974-1273(-)
MNRRWRHLRKPIPTQYLRMMMMAMMTLNRPIPLTGIRFYRWSCRELFPAENYFQAFVRFDNDPNAVELSKALHNATKMGVDVSRFLTAALEMPDTAYVA